MTRVAVFSIIFLVIWGVFTAVFAASAPKGQVRVLPKWVWVLACALVPFFGGLVYLMVGRPVGAGPKPNKRQPKTVAPDDDPRFLRDLNERLKREREQAAAGAPDAATPDSATPAPTTPDSAPADPSASDAAPADPTPSEPRDEDKDGKTPNSGGDKN